MPDYDAIVIGSGISGGWAAKELCEKGLKTLLLERGPMIEHPKDYKTANDAIWDDPHRERLTKQDKEIYPVQSTIYAFGHASRQYFVKDAEHPYIQEKPFGWIRGYQMGGRSLLWGRQSYRFSNLDFEANLKDGYGVDWPIRYHDIAPWYSYVERFVGISGAAEQLPQLPDSEFLPPMPMNCLEKEVKARLEKAYNNHRKLIMGRVANLTVPHKGRGPCQYRNRCHLGCPFGGYFSTNSATLPAAIATGKLTIRPNSIVAELIYDSKRNRIKGVRVIDADTKQHQEFYAKIVFLNASTIATAAILLQSKSAEFPNGIGNNYNQVGHNLLNHHVGVGATGQWEGFTDKYYSGRRANGPYLPRFQNLGDDHSYHPNFLRGYAFQTNAQREGWSRKTPDVELGAALKNALSEPGNWTMNFGGFGEILPNHDNHVRLHPTLKDQWGLPQVVISCGLGSNELAMRKDMMASAAEMLERVGFTQVSTFDRATQPGARLHSVHEMGTARMGSNKETSVVNKYNQVHGLPNLFITDGACMSSSACQNPSLTYMALTARACDFAVRELKNGTL